MPARLTPAAVAIAILGVSAGTALAQEPNPNVPVQERARRDYDPLGMRMGAFLLYPQMDLTGGYDSNVFADKTDEKDALVGIVAPRLRAVSQWSRHQLVVSAGSEAAFYSDYTKNNYVDFDLGARGRVDITRDDELRPRLKFARGHDDRSDPDDQGLKATNDITQWYETLAELEYRHNFNKFYVAPRAVFTRLDYDGAGDIDTDGRDRNQYDTGLRVGYMASPRFDLWLDGGYRWIRYDREDDDVDRNSEAYTLRAGTGIDITSILFGEIYVGYAAVDYESNELKNVHTPTAGADLTWNVTTLTSVIFNVNGAAKETTVTENGEPASANLQGVVGINVWHELLRNLLLNGYGQYVRNDFEGISRKDNTYRVGGGVRYLLNRNFSLDGIYTFVTRDSNVDDVGYDRNQIMLTLNARL
ncbi:MAG: outer membrane beta-barrel protein [Geminicoccaceae bacterium]